MGEAKRVRFAHEGLEAYGVARELPLHGPPCGPAREPRALAHGVARRLPRGEAALADQLERAATSVLLNTAEGAGRRASRDKARFFDVARGSALECAAILDVCALRGLAAAALTERGRLLLHREAGLLFGLARSALARSGAAGFPP